jgi:tRNA (cmo5U34)-methyltransferase
VRAGVGALFDEAAAGYDRVRRQLVPPFDDFYATVVESIPYKRDAPIRVLDLGAGTGLLSSLVARAFPRARITLVYVSPEMLEVARQRLADESACFELRVMDYSRETLPGEYEAVVSALSIHHLDNPEKRWLFHKVYGVLCDGGVFVNADQVLGPTPEIEARYREVWLRQVREKGVDEDDLRAALARMKEDKMSTLEEQRVWLGEAGFRHVDCLYKNYSFTVYSGYKSAQVDMIPTERT